jgi:hypothetical protein
VIEVEDLLPEVEVLERRRAPLTDAQGVLIVTYRNALLRSEYGAAGCGDLVGLTAVTAYAVVPPCDALRPSSLGQPSWPATCGR